MNSNLFPMTGLEVVRDRRLKSLLMRLSGWLSVESDATVLNMVYPDENGNLEPISPSSASGFLYLRETMATFVSNTIFIEFLGFDTARDDVYW